MVRSSPIMFFSDRNYYFVFTNIFFKKPLYKFHEEKSWINNNEASKQNLSQQWIAARLINHNFSINKISFVRLSFHFISFHLTLTARLGACRKNLSTSVFVSNLAITFVSCCIPLAMFSFLDAFYFEFSSFFGVGTNCGGWCGGE